LKFSIRTLAPAKAAAGCLVLAVQGGENLARIAQQADKAAGGALRRALARGDLAAKAGSTLLLHGVAGIAAERVLLLRLGERGKYDVSALREAVRGMATALKALGAKDAVLPVADLAVGGRGLPWTVRMTVLGLREGFYAFDQLKTQKKSPAPALGSVTLGFVGAPVTLQAQAALKEAVATADGADLARTLGNLPPNLCTPSYLADEARKLAKQFKLGIEVLERKDMERLGMGALLAVTAGSRQPPKLIVLRYAGAAKSKKPLVLVGKGITFDTGGISLKPAAEMDEMKYDMSGGGSVLGTFKTLARLALPLNVIGIVPAVENMPGGNACRPGDVVTSMSGQTIEILNTDAEGRLVLCDALTYAERFQPACVIDIATLTGACVIALGSHASGLFANDDALAAELLSCGADSGDRAWQLPLWDDYQSQLRSNFADMSNLGGRAAGAVTAACFLARFTKAYTWAHLDVAGTASVSGDAKGSTGRPVPLLSEFLFGRAGA
jgi:leucyl aminopeptidase